MFNAINFVWEGGNPGGPHLPFVGSTGRGCPLTTRRSGSPGLRDLPVRRAERLDQVSALQRQAIRQDRLCGQFRGRFPIGMPTPATGCIAGSMVPTIPHWGRAPKGKTVSIAAITDGTSNTAAWSERCTGIGYKTTDAGGPFLDPVKPSTTIYSIAANVFLTTNIQNGAQRGPAGRPGRAGRPVQYLRRVHRVNDPGTGSGLRGGRARGGAAVVVRQLLGGRI